MLKSMLFKRALAMVVAGCLMVTSMAAQREAATLPAQQAAPAPGVVKVEKNVLLQGALMQPLDPATARPGDDVPLRLTRPLTVGGLVVLPEGMVLHGTVTRVTPAGRHCAPGLGEMETRPGPAPRRQQTENRGVASICLQQRQSLA